jgi:hypothetical protein
MATRPCLHAFAVHPSYAETYSRYRYTEEKLLEIMGPNALIREGIARLLKGLANQCTFQAPRRHWSAHEVSGVGVPRPSGGRWAQGAGRRLHPAPPPCGPVTSAGE